MILFPKLIVSACFILNCSSLFAMEAAPRKKIREMVEFSESKHSQQVVSFIEAYMLGTVILGTDNSVVFDDYLNNNIAYMVSHSQIMRLIESIASREEELRKQNAEILEEWMKQPLHSEFSTQQVEKMQALRLAIFECGIDFDVLKADDTLKRDRSKDLEEVRRVRQTYKKAFRDQNQKTFSQIPKANIHARDFCPLLEQVKALQDGGKLKLLLAMIEVVAKNKKACPS